MSEHYSVLLNESIDLLNIKPDGTYIDMTLGRGGHSSLILSKLNEKGLLIGFDQDKDAIEKSDIRLKKFGKNYKLIHSNFKDFEQVLEELNITRVDGFIYDLGVSSPQFDEQDRGFSYRMEARLDMRMDTRNTLDAHYVVNNYSLKDLTRIFKEYGEEKFAYQIAKEIVKVREKNPIDTTFDLVEIIKKVLPNKILQKKGHPAKQVFQALRIEVNDELNILQQTLIKSLQALKIGGRCAVITFHSLEDKIVKSIFKDEAVIEGNRLNFGPIEEANYRLVNRKVILASVKELEENSRSKSAKLRVIERVK